MENGEIINNLLQEISNSLQRIELLLTSNIKPAFSIMTTKEVREYLNISRHQYYKLIASGKFPVPFDTDAKGGKTYLFIDIKNFKENN